MTVQSVTKVMTKPVANQKSRKTQQSRARSDEAREAKRQPILDAALDVFAERGFADARLEDVAGRAGVAKGTVYLYVSSKQALFEELVRTGHRRARRGDARRGCWPRHAGRGAAAHALCLPAKEVLGTRRREIVRLLLAEAGRFPELAELYHREVVTRGVALLRPIAAARLARGEFASDELARFPQLVVAPAPRRAPLDDAFSSASSRSTPRRCSRRISSLLHDGDCERRKP